MKDLEIYGTFGPNCQSKDRLIQLIEAGMTGIRLNLSHSNLEDHPDWLEAFYQAQNVTQKKADLLIDMKGPELRIGAIQPINCEVDTLLDLDALKLPACIFPLVPKEKLLLDDGKIELEVLSDVQARVLRGGLLTAHKSIALENREVTTPELGLCQRIWGNGNHATLCTGKRRFIGDSS